MNFFDQVKEEIKNENFNLIESYQTWEGKRKTREAELPMKEFVLNGFRNAILINVAKQNLNIRKSTVGVLLNFLSEEAEDITRRIYIQVLVHYSKMSVDLLKDKYEDSAEYYNTALLNYTTVASFEENRNLATNALPSLVDFAQDYLKTGPILTALQNCLEKLGTPKTKVDLREEISSMKIYVLDQFKPLPNLRGACLTDGLLICTNMIPGWPTTDKGKADMITLISHEICHYLARLSVRDFNFSSPYKLLEGARMREDPAIENRPLELGRCIELALFDGVQPLWSASSENAAKEFLNRLRKDEKLPVLKASEFQKLGLLKRLNASPPFAIDMEWSFPLC